MAAAAPTAAAAGITPILTQVRGYSQWLQDATRSFAEIDTVRGQLADALAAWDTVDGAARLQCAACFSCSDRVLHEALEETKAADEHGLTALVAQQSQLLQTVSRNLQAGMDAWGRAGPQLAAATAALREAAAILTASGLAQAQAQAQAQTKAFKG
jgi:AcrR family transcriptional regulator